MRSTLPASMARLHILAILAAAPAHGYEILTRLRTALRREVSTSQVYPFLATLRKKGYVRLRARGNREKKQYALTPAGMELFRSMLARMEPVIESAVRGKVAPCAHCGAQMYGGAGHRERIGGKTLLFCCRYCAASYRRGNNLNTNRR